MKESLGQFRPENGECPVKGNLSSIWPLRSDLYWRPCEYIHT
jgi:hypothetical protein